MSDEEPSRAVLQRRVNTLESRVQKDHETRISRNERYRLQAQGALKFAALVLGSGVITWLLTAAI